jgi:5-methylcytosine-specific restriction enzyme subunit McrC
MTISINLQEWSQRSATDRASSLAGIFLKDVESRTLAQQLTDTKMLEIREMREGLSIASTSYVGRIALGELVITVQPKISGMSLVHLLHYAYGLRDLKISNEVAFSGEYQAFQELLIQQLIEEISELVARGLQRRYVRTDQVLANPRGRIDLQSIAKQGGAIQATLPCTHYSRLEDCLINQVVLQGLHQAALLTDDSSLRMKLYRLVSVFEEVVSPIRVDEHILKRIHREMDRLTTAYKPALTIIEMLLAAEGISLAENLPKIRLPGFLFNMDLFFQSLLSRFLNEHLVEYEIRDQYKIKGMMAYDPDHNPRRRRSPTPRPDYVVLQKGQVVSILDAKYRDLWERDLPANMLYQLAIYALSRQQEKIAVILYPNTHDEAQEARIMLSEPTYGTGKAAVVLRPVNLLYLEELVTGTRTASNERKKEGFARQLIFGEG